MTPQTLRRLAAPALALCALVSAGCATIVGGGTSQAVSLASTPAGATFTVKSSSGVQMAQGQAPQTLRLPRKNEYQVEIAMPGYQPQTLALTKGLNGWVFGNLIIGWIPGFIIDFASGSANKLEPSLISVSLVKTAVALGEPGSTSDVVAVVRFLSESGRLVREQRVPMVPVQEGTGR